MTLWRWTKGRIDTGYFKMLLAGWAPYFDVYLLKFPEGSFVPIHKDPVTGRKHFRLNIILLRADEGGFFACEKQFGSAFARIVLFRPDVQKHMLTTVEKGTQYMLSIGWTRS